MRLKCIPAFKITMCVTSKRRWIVLTISLFFKRRISKKTTKQKYSVTVGLLTGWRSTQLLPRQSQRRIST